MAYGMSDIRHGAMRWEEAIALANQIAGWNKLAAYALSYHYLDCGPAELSKRERTLRQTVSLIREGEELPIDLGCDLFAWVTATSNAQRRLSWDLPPSWSDPESGSR